MHPADLAQERQLRARKHQRELAIRVRHAGINATDEERSALQRLAQAVTDGHITVDHANDCVRALLTQQHARRAAA